MKKLIAFLLLALALPAFGQRVTLTVTVTNKAATGDGITVNGGLRYFTNATKATTIATNLTSINATKTNLFNQFAAYPWSGLTLADGNTNAGSGTNSFRLVGSAISASLTGTWGYLTLSTQAGSSTFPMLYPLANVVGETNRTNQASDVVAGLNSYATNSIATNATPLGNYLTKGASTQQVVIAPVQFNGTLRAGGGVALTNGFTRSVTNISPVTSNLVNYGNAIRSEGIGGNSLQVGSNAVSSGSLSMALGNAATASGANSTALGVGASATNTDATAVGTSASAAANAIAIGSGTSASGSASVSIGYATTADAASAVSIGNGATASAEEAIALGGALAEGLNSISIGDGSEVQAGANNSIAVGAGSIVGYSNSVAIGYQSAATTTNQIRLGNSDSVVSVPGFIRGTLSNLVTVSGQTNVLAGDLSTPIGSITTVANGANRVNMGTQSVVNITGSPTATWSIDGVIFGTVAPRDGHRLHIRNNSGYNATLTHNSGLEAVAGYRLSSPSGVDLILTNGAMAQLVYSAADSRWLVWSVFDGRVPGVSASATNVLTSLYTNGVSVSGALLTNLNIIYGTNMVFRATNNSGSVDLHISSAAAGGGGGGSSLVTNGNQFGADTTLTIKSGALVTNLVSYGTSTAPAGRFNASALATTNAFEVWTFANTLGVSVSSNGTASFAGEVAAGSTVTATGFKSSTQDSERVLGTDAGGNFVETTTAVATLAYIDNVTSDIQTQLDGKLSSATNGNQFLGTTLSIKSGALLTNLYIYGNSTNVGTLVNATSYHSNLVYRPISLASPASTLTVDLAGGSMQVVTMTNNTTVAITNAAAGVNVSVLFIGPTNNQFNLIMPSGVRLFSGAITNAVTTNKSAIVSFTAYDSISTNVIATVAIEP